MDHLEIMWTQDEECFSIYTDDEFFGSIKQDGDDWNFYPNNDEILSFEEIEAIYKFMKIMKDK